MDRWRTVAATVALVSGVVVAATQDPTWPPSEVFMLGAEEWLGSPATRAADGLPRLLLSGAPYDESSVLEAWTWAYLPSTDPEVVKNEACRNDVKAVIKAIRNPLVYAEVLLKGHLWPVILPDSWGKVPDGLLTGNFQPWGMMEECTMLHVHELIDFPLKPFDLNTTFDGKYCAVSFRKSTDVEEQPGPQPRIGAFMPAIPLYFYGTCMPSSCAADDLRVSLDARMSALGKQTSAVDCQTRNDTKTLEAADIVVIVVLTVLGGLLLAGAALDIGINYSDQQQLRKGPWRFLLAFSAYTNIKKIFAISNKKNPEVISCLHGMRVMSMTWVVWAHCYIFFYTYSTNLLGIQEVTDDVLDETVDNAGFSVDTFFFISGFLVTYGVLKEFSRVGRINWIMYYVHRVIRLAPPIALTGAVMATLARFLVFGPLAMHIERTVVEICQQYWWADFLFATNFMNHMCLAQCWYTAVDTQIYIVLPLVLAPLLYKRKIGLPLLGLVTAVSFAIPTTIAAVYNVPPAFNFIDPVVKPTARVDTYMTPWCRANSYMVGVWAGWLIYTVRGRTIKLKLWQTVLGWAAATTVASLVLYGMARYDTWGDDQVPLPRAPSIIYAGFSRGAWCLALLWLVFACHTGNGGLINSFLSHPSWQPLSRLTYTLYLTAVPLQSLFPGQVYLPFYINHLNMIVYACGFLFIGGILAVLLSVMTEGPVIGLEKLLLHRPGRGLSDIPDETKITRK
ncbi:nose resistant to fluoxetine protein 6 [Procambarus clarkii]|uniref:nose resistant to fluoxetine protein 6 n=1 Tax=Procambarus clarkii TaxID=6728 RepID=UPI001E6773F5|nr:nose resistant to fluoxetine protein 6-like [Procambarus clarkii]